MRCISPMSVKNPSSNDSKDRVVVPCGKCPACLKNHRNEWTQRVMFELQDCYNAFFVTLTYSDEYLPFTDVAEGVTIRQIDDIDISDGGKFQPSVNMRDLQLWIKKIRKEIIVTKDDLNYKFRYYLTSEYGPRTARPHYHAILFNVPERTPEFNTTNIKLNVKNFLEKHWQMGDIDVGDVTQASIHYVTGYVVSRGNYPPLAVKPFKMLSKRPGIGAEYLRKFGAYHKKTQRFYTMVGGVKLNLPRYYRDKIFNHAEKEYHRIEVQKVQSDKEAKVYPKDIEAGENYFLSEFERKKQLKEIFERNNKKAKKL